MADEKNFLQKVSWDGDPQGWPDFVRRVRLIFERTKRSRRHLLAPEIVTNLTGRAWNITQDLDHAALVRRNGTIYLLEFLRDRLGKNPVPDVGLRLRELVIRLKRPAGMSMATWSSNVRQVYRRAQVALARARKDFLLRAPSLLGRPGSQRSPPRLLRSRLRALRPVPRTLLLLMPVPQNLLRRTRPSPRTWMRILIQEFAEIVDAATATTRRKLSRSSASGSPTKRQWRMCSPPSCSVGCCFAELA